MENTTYAFLFGPIKFNPYRNHANKVHFLHCPPLHLTCVQSTLGFAPLRLFTILDLSPIQFQRLSSMGYMSTIVS